jgi:hypothetical protein
MRASELISELARCVQVHGDLKVVLGHGLGSMADVVFWDEDANCETVIVVGD